jgi:hypothetical protein
VVSVSDIEDLIFFLRAQLDDDERVARAANPGPWRRFTDREHLSPLAIFGGSYMGDEDRLRNVVSLKYSWVKDGNAEHITRWDPIRALAEVDAKRRLLDEYERIAASANTYPGPANAAALIAAQKVVKILGWPHVDHPDYREEWRP